MPGDTRIRRIAGVVSLPANFTPVWFAEGDGDPNLSFQEDLSSQISSPEPVPCPFADYSSIGCPLCRELGRKLFDKGSYFIPDSSVRSELSLFVGSLCR